MSMKDVFKFGDQTHANGPRPMERPVFQPSPPTPRKPQFVAEEVWRISRAVLASAILHDVTHGKNAFNECRYCGRCVYWDADADGIQHELGCVVLIARDLLTGAPKESP